MTEGRPNQGRRKLLGAVGSLALAGAATACAPVPVANMAVARPYSRKPFAAPRVTMDAVIRVIVGLRPYRPSGFVVRRETFDDTTVVHNYGHGGGGLSLSWGSSALAVRETLGMTPGEVAVIGSGIMGLTSARLLQDAGWDVTIYTRDVWRHTTSNVAAGEWSPYSVYDETRVSAGFLSRFEWASKVAHHAYTNLTGPEYGIRWLEGYTLGTRPFGEFDGRPELHALYPYKRNLVPGEHPFGDYYAQAFVTMQIDPGVLLRRLVDDFRVAGGRFVVRDFKRLDAILALPESLVFNCTGLGSRDLFGDEELTAAKGQLVYIPPDPAVDFFTFGGGRGILYMFPRSDVIVLGGTFKPGDFSRHAEPEETERIVRSHRALFAEFG